MTSVSQRSVSVSTSSSVFVVKNCEDLTKKLVMDEVLNQSCEDVHRDDSSEASDESFHRISEEFWTQMFAGMFLRSAHHVHMFDVLSSR